MFKIWSRFALSILLVAIVLSGCSITRTRAVLNSKDAIIIDDYIRYIDKYLTGKNELVFDNAKELSSETLYEFIHFINEKDELKVVKFDDGKFYLTLYGAKWILDKYFKSYRFNPIDMLAFDAKQEVFIGQKRNYNFEEELEAIYIRSKEIVGGKLVVVADYYDLFDIEKLYRLYSKTYTLKLEQDGYKYISVKKELNNSIEQIDYNFYLNYYVKPLVKAGLTQKTWKKAEELDADSLLYYACIPFLNSNISNDKYHVKEGDSGYLHLPAYLVEKQIYKKFVLPENFLKLSEAYNIFEDCYVKKVDLDLTLMPDLKVINVKKMENELKIIFERKDSNQEDTSIVELVVVENEESFKYMSCNVTKK